MSSTKTIYSLDADFYCSNAYEEREKQRGVVPIVIKTFLMVLLIALVLWGFKHFMSSEVEVTKNITPVTTLQIVEEKENLETSSAKEALNVEEITKIVQTVMVQMNTQNEKSVESTSTSPSSIEIEPKEETPKVQMTQTFDDNELSQDYVNAVRNALGK